MEFDDFVLKPKKQSNVQQKLESLYKKCSLAKIIITNSNSILEPLLFLRCCGFFCPTKMHLDSKTVKSHFILIYVKRFKLKMRRNFVNVE